MCSLILILLYSIPANAQIMSATNNNVIMAQRHALRVLRQRININTLQLISIFVRMKVKVNYSLIISYWNVYYANDIKCSLTIICIKRRHFNFELLWSQHDQANDRLTKDHATTRFLSYRIASHHSASALKNWDYDYDWNWCAAVKHFRFPGQKKLWYASYTIMFPVIHNFYMYLWFYWRWGKVDAEKIT